MKLVTCENLNLGYESTISVKDATFAIESGDYMCVVGENGSGKSTLVKGVLGLLKPISGSIKYHEGLVESSIGYLPQQKAAQKDFPATVYEVVISGCLHQRGFLPFYSYKEKRIAVENMRKLKIEELKNLCYRDLSGGQQQRVLLARALSAANKLLILDEPVTGLDPVATSELYGIIKELNKEYGVAILMVSHDIHSVLSEADKIIQLKREVLFQGTVKDYKKSIVGQQFLGGSDHDK